MSITNIEKISKTIHLLDKHIYNIIKKEDVDIDKVNTIVSVRNEYISELNSLIRVNNRNELFKKKNYKG
tara:strand:- start:244 stop:450 length:207 start_codon:yes stop_codon:yes gene_type:complete